MLSNLPFLSIFLLLLAITTFAFPTHPGSCLLNGIASGHGQNYAPSCPNCYYLTLTKSTNPPSGASGNTWNVVLKGPNAIKGLMLWAFDTNTNSRFGSWVTYPTYTGPLTTCGGVNPQGNTIGHTSAQFKKLPLNFVWSDLGYTSSSKSSSKRSLNVPDNELFKDTRPGMREEIERELEKRAMINPGTVIAPSAIPSPPSGTQNSPSTTPTKAISATTSAVTPTTTKGTIGGGGGGTNSTGSSSAAWTGTMLGLVVVDFTDWYFVTKVNFNANMASAGGIATNTTSSGGTNSTSGGGTTTGSGSGGGSNGGGSNSNGDGDGDGDDDDTSDGGLFIVNPSDILSKNHMLYVAIALSAVFFLSGWGVEAFMMAQEKKVRSFAKKWKT